MKKKTNPNGEKGRGGIETGGKHRERKRACEMNHEINEWPRIHIRESHFAGQLII